jgi:tetratricopeptide (TPR) repeat protein
MAYGSPVSGTLVDDLRERLLAGRVIVVAGSGVAAAATGGDPCASWVGLIESGLRHVENLPNFRANRVDAARTLLLEEDPASLIMAAEVLTESLGGRESGEYGRWLRETVGSLVVQDGGLPRALARLGAPIVTTNYDGLIEAESGLDRVSWDKPARVQLALQGPERAVVHLHGHWLDPELVILGVRSYEEILNDGPAQALQHAAAAMTSLLFVGMGDGVSDPNFGALRDWLRGNLGGSQVRHFRLCLDHEVDGLAKEHEGEPILPLAYGREHEELVAFLASLPDAPSKYPALTPTSPGASKRPAVLSLPGCPVTLGRDAVIADLVLRLMGEPAPMLLLLGAPGIGKTNLTLAAIHDADVGRKFGARRWFVRCDETATASDLLTQIAGALSLPLDGDLVSSVLTHLSEAPGVIALDNLETPWEGDTLAVEDILGRLADTGVTVVASLRGLEQPAGVKWSPPVQLEPLGPDAAKKLFLSISSPTFNAPGLADLLEEMGGVPLAIELLAHASEGEPDLSHLIGRWRTERSRLLKRRDADHRLLNVAVSIDLSWNSKGMVTQAQRLLSLMGWLPNGVAEEDLETLVPVQGISAASCLRRRGLALHQAGRLRVLPPIRHHVAQAHPPSEDDWARLETHFIDRAIELGSRAGRVGGGDATRKLASEAANVSTVLSAALRARPTLRTFSAARAYIYAAVFVGMDALELAYTAVKAAEESGEEAVSAAAWRSLGDISLRLSGRDAARDAYEQALPKYKQAGDLLGEANCIKSLGDVAFHSSDHKTARDAYEKALPIYKEASFKLGEANCIKSLGNIALQRSDLDTARDTYEQALPIYQEVDDLLGEANCVRSLGDIALRRSDHEAARDKYEQALPLYKQTGNLLGEANCIACLGDIALRHSDHDAARDTYEQALPLYKQIGDLLGEANCIKGLGDIALERSDHGAANDAYQQALPLYKRAGDLLGEANCIGRMGDIAFQRGDHDPARRAYERALPIYERISEQLGQANCIASLGDIAVRCSDHDAAHDAYERARPIYKGIGELLGEANCIKGLGDLAFARTDHDAAADAYERALALYESAGSLYSVGATHLNLARNAQATETRCHHAQQAKQAWTSIDREDMIARLTSEFGDCFSS